MNTIYTILITLFASIAFAIVASVLGCLLAGLDRKLLRACKVVLDLLYFSPTMMFASF